MFIRKGAVAAATGLTVLASLVAGIAPARASGGGLPAAGSFAAYYINQANPLAVTQGPGGSLWTVENKASGGLLTEFSTGSAVLASYPIRQASSEVVYGPSGSFWILGASSRPYQILQVTPSGVETDYPLPSADSDVTGLAAGPDGNLWFVVGADGAANGSIGTMTPQGAVTQYPLPVEFQGNGRDIAAGPDGNLWFVGESGGDSSTSSVGMITPQGVITMYPLLPGDSQSSDIAAGPDGSLWFLLNSSVYGTSAVGQITTSGVVSYYPLPYANMHPLGLAAGPDGNIYIASGLGGYGVDSDVGDIMALDPASGAVQIYPGLYYSVPDGIAAGPDGNLYFAVLQYGELGKFTVTAPDSASIAVTSDANPAVYGQPGSLTATITPNGQPDVAPSGTVTFEVSGVRQPPVPVVDGTATLPFSALPSGTTSIQATYDGDANFGAVTSQMLLYQTVNTDATTTTLTSSANPAAAGQDVQITAAVTATAPSVGSPTGGSVTFYVDGSGRGGAALQNGVATLDLPNLSPGSHTITATYYPGAGYQGSSASPLTETVTQSSSASVALASSANPAVYGQASTITATVTPGGGSGQPTPTGTVTFSVDGTAGSPVTLSGGTVSYALPVLTPGAHNVTAAYSGDATYPAASSNPLTQSVNQAATTTTLASSANPSAIGAPVTFTASVAPVAPGAGSPTGIVTFAVDGSQQSPATVTAGSATLTLSSLAPGSHTITAAYSGDGDFAASTAGALTQTVNQPISTSTTLTVSPSGTVMQGSAVTLTATESPITAGSVQFLDGATALGSPVPVDGSGTATTTTTSLAAGSHSLTAVFTPSSPGYAASTSAPSTLQITSAGIAIDQTVTMSGVGTVTTGTFSTSGPRLLVAFTSSDGPATKQTTTVTGGGLTWTLAQRANAKGGTAEIWTAYATGPLANVTVTSTPKSAGYAQLLTVEVLSGASGVGAGAIGGKAGGSPTVAVTTTKAGSWAFGVGEDYSRATTVTPGANQTVLERYLDSVNGDTFWVQNQNNVTSTVGTKVTINDTAPSGDTWNMAAIEILAAG